MVRIRARDDDFEVTEIPLYEPSGEGDHTFVWVEKRGRSTHELAEELARLAGSSAREVGFAGRKDRHAVTRQWFSVPRLEPERALAAELRDARVLAARRHRHKLRTGQLAGNRFRLRLVELAPGEAAVAALRLQQLTRWGFPNRFGGQRFGRRGDNARLGAEVLRGRPMKDRRHARFLVSALQSEVFNRVLERRLELVPEAGMEPGRRSVDRLLDGDLAQRHDSGGCFLVDGAAAEQPRADRLEISPTGPIFGRRMSPPGGDVARLEQAVLDELAVPAEVRIRGIDLPGARRSLRALVRDATLAAPAESGGAEAWLEVALESGVYVTVLLEELFNGVEIVDRSGEPAVE